MPVLQNILTITYIMAILRIAELWDASSGLWSGDIRTPGDKPLNCFIHLLFLVAYNAFTVSTCYLLHFLSSKGGNHQLSKGLCLTIQWLGSKPLTSVGKREFGPLFIPFRAHTDILQHLWNPMSPFFWCFAHKSNKKCL